ncbi:hypothetical protein [Deinococcus apachensis]|uniref:hypothetical protein n=1 Tax=Deinococcus apachensis TaxID=309886 RepID=UPI000367176A|nr:hypothetical protein [Deinococcus apachensis]
MHSTLKKLNYAGHPDVFVLNAPENFQPVLDEMRNLTTVHTQMTEDSVPAFILTFATRQDEVDDFARQVGRRTRGDAVVWIAYPKGTSKRHTCEFNRDTGWAELGAQGFEPVRQVAIDEDWTALRFRRVGFIKTLRRRGALSEEGRKRTGG